MTAAVVILMPPPQLPGFAPMNTFSDLCYPATTDTDNIIFGNSGVVAESHTIDASGYCNMTDSGGVVSRSFCRFS